MEEASCGATDEASTTCSASPGPSPVTPGGAITPPSSAPPKGLTYTLYDNYGNQLYTITGVYEPGSSSASYSQTSYTLYSGNTVILGSSNISCGATPPSASLPCATINPDGVVTQLAYYGSTSPYAGLLETSATPDGNGSEIATTTYTYDADGEQTSVTSPDGNLTGANAGNYTTVVAYNSDAQKTSVSQGDGSGHTVTPRITQYGYDGDGNQTTVDDARGYTTTTTYDADDQPALVADPDGNATLTCYDGDGDTTQTVPPAGVAANSLSPASCPAAYPAGYGDRLASDSTTATYDSNGNQVSVTTPAPAGQSGHETTTYTYDSDGDLLTTTAPPATSGGSNQVTADTYNAASELAAQTTGYGTSAASTVSWCYDPDGDVTSSVYPDGNASGVASCESSSPWIVSSSSYPTQAAGQTTYSYDSAGELAATTRPATSAAPSGAITSYTYDAAGNNLTSADPDGVTTTRTYTPAGQSATVSYSGSSAHSVSYTYDANGDRTAMTDASGTSSYGYDAFGQLTSDANGAGQTTGYGYDADGDVTSVTYPLPAAASWPTSDSVTYAFDHADRLTSVTDFNGNQIAIGDTADGLPNAVTFGTTGDSVATTYGSNDLPSLIKLKNSTATLQSFSYSDGPAGDILTETDTPSSSQSPAVYTYDAQDRVTSMTPGSGSTLGYGLDASGSLTTLPTGATGSYDNAGELTSSTLSGTATNYTYNADGQRLAASQGASTIASGSWNGAGQLTSYSDPVATLTAATYDGDGDRVAASTSTGTQSFVWNTVPEVPEVLMDSANAYIYDGGLAPAEQVSLTSGTVTYLVSDSLGSVRGTVSSSGSVTGTTNYDAWGNPESSGGLTGTTPFGFAGGYTDPTGLVYLINRYYDPQTGQFTSVDPLVAQTLQPYAYAGGDPVSSSDPTGLQRWPQSDGNNCLDCAKKIQKIIGGKIHKILGKHHAKLLGPSTQDPNNTYQDHYYVEKDGRSYDSWTGEGGKDNSDYQASWEFEDDLNFDAEIGGGDHKCAPEVSRFSASPSCS